MSRVHLIAAMSENRVIGRDNQLPWRLPADLKRFKAATMGHVLVMGRKTYESIGRPLPGRRTIVLSRDAGYRPEGVEVASSLSEALELAGDEEVFIAGGGEVYRRALEVADDILLTLVHGHIEGDAFFPSLNPGIWELVEEERRPADDRHAWELSFLRYRRRRDAAPTTMGVP
jgi:dihydrofolate reductase